MVLLAADGLCTGEIMRRAGTSKVTVWRWQERFVRAGVAGLLRDKTRSSRIPPLPASVHERTVALTLADPPGEAAHWTADMMSKAARISVSSVQRIWQAHGLQHHDITVTSDIQRRTPAWSASERGGGIRYMLVV